MSMSASSPLITITLERIQWFANYYKTNRMWGVFRVCLDDGNWYIGASSKDRETWPPDVVEAAEWFEMLTPPQRKRLRDKAEDRASRCA